MPSGAYVKMDVHDWGMNVYAYAPSEDINKTEGLCGTFDGDTSNDMRLRGSGRVGKLDEFIESWRWVSHVIGHVFFLSLSLRCWTGYTCVGSFTSPGIDTR